MPYFQKNKEIQRMNELTFKSYPSIENIDRKATIDKIVEMGFDQAPWQASLKIHGSNLQIITDSQNLVTAKRTDLIVPEDGVFYGYQAVIDRYQSNIDEFLRFLKTIFPSFGVCRLYGELFGGMYNHPDVKRDPSAIKVQKGVNYCPHNDFFLFDISLDGIFINKLYVTAAVTDFSFIGAKPLYQGSFRECLQLDPAIQDPLHKEFGLPTIEDNICEGFVIEPEEPKFFPNGSRVILKNKNAEFCEKASHKKQKIIQMPHEWTVQGAEECSVLFLYITENRLRNVLSHIGQVTDKDFGKIMGLMAQDTLKDYMKDREDKYNLLEKKEQDIIKKQLQRKVADLIRPNFTNILDNYF